MNAFHATRLATAIVLAPLALACDADLASVELTVYGEEFIEEGIPEDAFADGWAVEFTRFEVSIADMGLLGVDADPGTFDLTEPSDGEGQLVGTIEVPNSEVASDGEYVIERIEVEGIAQKDDVTKQFSWTFDAVLEHSECQGQEGGVFQATIHADHLFYDSLASEEPALRFEAIAAADSDDDGDVTVSELEAADIGDYDPGSGGGVENLWQYLEAASKTVGHANGEGHCHVTVL